MRNLSLPVNLSTIKDQATRDALAAVVKFVQDLGAKGLKTDGDIVGRSLNLASGGSFKTVVQSGSINPSGRALLVAPVGKWIGMFGMTQYHASYIWVPIQSATATGSIYFEFNSTESTASQISLVNGDASNTNLYRIVGFYSESL